MGHPVENTPEIHLTLSLPTKLFAIILDARFPFIHPLVDWYYPFEGGRKSLHSEGLPGNKMLERATTLTTFKDRPERASFFGGSPEFFVSPTAFAG